MDRSAQDGAQAQPRPLPAFHDKAPRDRYCDLILTGGITSAIAYPPAIFALASVYRLRSLGGSSSGAGSAALAAAAEYRRRHGSSEGFRLLLERSAAVAETTQGQTNLSWLFQPGPQKQRLFSVLVDAVAKSGDKPGQSFANFFNTYFTWPLLLVLAVLCLVATQTGPVAGFALGVVGLLTGIVWGLARLWRDVRTLLDDEYGLCSGLERQPGAQHPPLTQWLHDVIQEVAGRAEDAPLTFADLESAPGSPHETLGTCTAGDQASIRLQMFTSNLTLGRPYLFPIADAPDDESAAKQEADNAALYFFASDMRRLFPASVVNHMVKVSTPYAGEAALFDPVDRYRARRAAGEPLLRVPGKQLPILVAARMSVSFPILFNAVPLWTVENKRGERRLRRCLFADGGFCSNFPIHLFDSAVPDWPTFGISLRDLIPGQKGGTLCKQKQAMIDSIQLPQHHGDQIEEAWQDFDEKTTPLPRLGGFIGAMLATVKDWNDATLSRLPGVRDRVVRLGLSPGIGGLNILMSGEQIRVLAEVGGEAALRLIDRFALGEGPSGVAAGWREHRWVRFNILRDCLAETLSGFGASAASRKFTQPLAEHIDDATTEAPLAGEPPSKLRASQAAALQGVLAALQEAERALSASHAEQPYKPYPRPDLRIRPPL